MPQLRRADRARRRAGVGLAERIMVIRHAEKPDEHGRVGGVDPAGKADEHALSPLGWQRAGALVRFFAPRDGQFADPRLARPGRALRHRRHA